MGEDIIFKNTFEEQPTNKIKIYPKEMKGEKKQIAILIIMFISIIPAIIFIVMGIESLYIYCNSKKYRIGVLKIESFNCGNSYGGDDSNCYGYGIIENTKYVVNLGLAPDKTSLFKTTEHADLSKSQYDVFYMPKEENAILRKKGETEINKSYYLQKAILELILPIIFFSALIYFYNS